MPLTAATAPKTAEFTLTMRQYTIDADDAQTLPDDATNVVMERDTENNKVIRFHSDIGPEETTDDEQPCCKQCEADTTPESLAPRRKTPEGWN